MVGSAAAGHSKYLQKGWLREMGQLFAAPVLSDLQGKGYERKEASLLT